MCVCVSGSEKRATNIDAAKLFRTETVGWIRVGSRVRRVVTIERKLNTRELIFIARPRNNNTTYLLVGFDRISSIRGYGSGTEFHVIKVRLYRTSWTLSIDGLSNATYHL